MHSEQPSYTKHTRLENPPSASSQRTCKASIRTTGLGTQVQEKGHKNMWQNET